MYLCGAPLLPLCIESEGLCCLFVKAGRAGGRYEGGRERERSHFRDKRGKRTEVGRRSRDDMDFFSITFHAFQEGCRKMLRLVLYLHVSLYGVCESYHITNEETVR